MINDESFISDFEVLFFDLNTSPSPLSPSASRVSHALALATPSPRRRLTPSPSSPFRLTRSSGSVPDPHPLSRAALPSRSPHGFLTATPTRRSGHRVPDLPLAFDPADPCSGSLVIPPLLPSSPPFFQHPSMIIVSFRVPSLLPCLAVAVSLYQIPDKHTD